MNSSLIPRVYGSFRGLDYKNERPILNRSPYALNVWKSYKEQDCIESRPKMNKIEQFNNKINNIIHFNVNNEVQVIYHVGTQLIKDGVVIQENMNINESRYFIFRNVLFIIDGLHYYEYDGTTVKEVVGTIPMTSYYKNPDGSTNVDSSTDIDLVFQPVNVLTPYRKNAFIPDGESTVYQLDTTELDPASMGLVEAKVNNVTKVENIDFSVDRTKGTITFNEAPPINGSVEITFRKTISGYAERIKNSPLLAEFDNRIFFSGNPDYPNAVFHCELNDPRYVRDTAYYECGLNIAQIKAIIPGNGVLWVFKEIEQNNSSVYYMTPTIDGSYGKIYPSVTGNISKGCVGQGINYNDDIVYFSREGLEGIASTNLYSEQVLQHKSSLIDNKLVNEIGYENMKLAEWNGYLLCLIDSKIYLADYRQRFQDGLNVEYEWYYWEMPHDITYIKEYRGELYLGNDIGEIYDLKGTTEENFKSVWQTPKDNFDQPAYIKSTNKKGSVVSIEGTEVNISTIVDETKKDKGTFQISDTNDVVLKTKEKKFKDIRFEFESENMKLYSFTLQGYIAGYMKR